MDKITQNKLFETALNEHKGIFFKVAKTYCKDNDNRKDLLQEMMVQVWQSLPKYNAEFKLSTWLYRVVLNVAISYYRKYSRQQNIHQICLAIKKEPIHPTVFQAWSWRHHQQICAFYRLWLYR